MLVIDFEVFKHDWCCVIYSPDYDKYRVIANDAIELRRLYDHTRNQIYLGYNIRGYDQWIYKAILCGINPKEVNDFIINEGRNGAAFSPKLAGFPLWFFDVKTSTESLKTLEGFMGSDIQETSVSFDIDRKLMPREFDEVIKYCRHDVQETWNVCKLRVEEYLSQVEIANMFNLHRYSLGKTKAQLSAMALDATAGKFGGEFDYSIPENLHISKYAHVVEWFKSMQGTGPDMYREKLETTVAGVPHVFAWGGVHGALSQYHDTGVFINCDVSSYYPSLMLEYGYISRAIKDPAHYADIYHKRLEYKKAKDKRQKPLKIVLNSTYGALKDKFNPLYDPMQANNVCVAGQLLLLDLMEHVEAAGCADIVQSNTDGVLFKLRGDNDAEINANFALLDDVCAEWEKRTKMVLEFDEFVEVFQKDVNNYILKAADGSYKSKGTYVKELSPLDNDLPIVNEALVNYMVHGIPVETTINECDQLIKFQKILKVSNKYLYAQHNGKQLAEKTFRVFASNRYSDSPLYKVKSKGGALVAEKFANCPDHCFINNGKVRGADVPKKLNRDYYIELAKQRLASFFK